MSRNTCRSLALAALLTPLAGKAAITSNVTLNFQGIPTAVYGAANLAFSAPATCQGAGNCYFEQGVTIGVVDDPLGFGEHVHRAGVVANRTLAYHSDSSGIYLRADDNTAFALSSLRFSAPISIDNPDSGPGEEWEILGFDTAENPALASGNGTTYATRVAYQTVPNGFDGTLTLDASFNNVKAVWIHYKGFPGVPTAKDFAMTIDDVGLAPAVAPPAASPRKVPALGPALLALLAMSLVAVERLRRQSAGARAGHR